MNPLMEDGIAYQADPRVEAIFDQLCSKLRKELT